MKTTLDLPDELFKRAKSAANERGTSFKSVIVLALERFLGPEASHAIPLRTHVWPPEGATCLSIDSDDILRMIRDERAGSKGQPGDSEGLDRTAGATAQRAPKLDRKKRK